MYKKWYQSKTVWFNVIMTVTDAAALMAETVPEPYKVGLLALHGFGNIVLRIWFTDTEVLL